LTGLGQRHAGTLDGKLTEPGAHTASISIHIEPRAASAPAAQHTAWMLTNLLARLDQVVTEVAITGGDAPVMGRVVPLAPTETSLHAALIDGANTIGGVPVHARKLDDPDILLSVGPGGATDGWRVHGEGYCGAISRGAIESRGQSALPFGPYIAACLAAGEVFRAVRLAPASYTPTADLSYSAWSYTLGRASELHDIGPDLDELPIDFGLAGVGAVGGALLHALWACPHLTGRALIADPDPKGVEDTNLNRYVLFGQAHLGQPKASAAADVCRESPLQWEPVDHSYSRQRLPWIPELLASAVDTNRARDQLQQGYWPARLLAASTNNLRAEILRCGPPGEGPCLRCFNPPEVDLPDDVRRAHLRELNPGELKEFALKIGQPAILVQRWADEGGCGAVADAALAHLRLGDQQPSLFAVSFVSALAGTLLAAEVVKEHLNRPTFLNDELQSAKFQFISPAATGNGHPAPARRDPTCPACLPGNAGTETWARRARDWSPWSR
jgi:hypothetical protein